jgi:hypothetical protein
MCQVVASTTPARSGWNDDGFSSDGDNTAIKPKSGGAASPITPNGGSRLAKKPGKKLKGSIAKKTAETKAPKEVRASAKPKKSVVAVSTEASSSSAMNPEDTSWSQRLHHEVVGSIKTSPRPMAMDNPTPRFDAVSCAAVAAAKCRAFESDAAFYVGSETGSAIMSPSGHIKSMPMSPVPSVHLVASAISAVANASGSRFADTIFYDSVSDGISSRDVEAKGGKGDDIVKDDVTLMMHDDANDFVSDLVASCNSFTTAADIADNDMLMKLLEEE